MDEILHFLEQSIADQFFSKDEKKDLRELLVRHAVSADQLSTLRNKVFSLAKDHGNERNFAFILEWVQYATQALYAAAAPQSAAYFSPGESCRQAIMRQIQQAVHHIDICVFTISDDRIVDAILTAHRKGIAIRILTDNDKSFDLGSDIARLAKAGIDIKIDHTTDHMHHKFMVTDDAVLLTGSYNWTNSAARVNQENIIVTDDEKLVKDFLREFTRLWQGMSVYR
jgi:phosphatidylserine/phosphatidylglycerophosphate/cardiolipin synthase-like enzyme